MSIAGRNSDQSNIRFPEGLRDRIKDSASASGRSINSEIIERLEASFETPRALDSEISRLLDEHINRKVAERLSEIARTLGGGETKR
jgi:hypothetical protein